MRVLNCNFVYSIEVELDLFSLHKRVGDALLFWLTEKFSLLRYVPTTSYASSIPNQFPKLLNHSIFTERPEEGLNARYSPIIVEN